jgi:hypothetical protein
MKAAARLFRILAGLALGGAAPASASPAPVEGLYVAHRMETASALQLTADGRFEWMFSTGALDMGGEGRWTRGADGVIRLNSDPPVVAPRFELVGNTKSGDPGVLVRLADESGEAPVWLGALAEYRDGGTSGGRFEGGEHYFEPDPARPIAAIRIAAILGIQSERHAVAPGDVLSFRFHANDMGKADFRDVRVAEEPGALSFTWMGTKLRYVREGARGARAAPADDAAISAEAAAAAEAVEAADAVEEAARAAADAVQSAEAATTGGGMDSMADEDEAVTPPVPARAPFRPGERVEIVNQDWPERHGAIGDVRYSYLVDHRGLVLKGAVDGPATDKGDEPAQGEPGDMADDPDAWDLSADRGGMEEGDRWSIMHEKTGLWLKMSPDGHVAEICLSSVEYQDRAHRIRIGDNPPIRISTQDCNTADAALIERQLRAGGPMVMSASIWTNPVSADRTGDAGLFGMVMSLFDYLRGARD